MIIKYKNINIKKNHICISYSFNIKRIIIYFINSILKNYYHFILKFFIFMFLILFNFEYFYFKILKI